MGDTVVTVLDSPAASGLDDAAQAVERAGEGLQQACSALARRGDDVGALRAAVSSAARLTRALASAVDGIVHHAPRSVGRGETADDLVADLKALRNCLATGAAVVDPALDDLHDLAGFGTDPEFTRRYQEWAAASTPAGS
ncbi:hypothetical protein SAXI111661_07665 [Saccharomonospora xinjiangensis]|nr:hypothetical protein EYD13_04580 [Saccharomonospora xinjiangensis]